MNSRKLFGASAILSLALSIPAHAGEVQTPTAASVPPPPTSSLMPPTAPESSTSAELAEAPGMLFTDMLLSMLWLY